jgi:hypothetical protein
LKNTAKGQNEGKAETKRKAIIFQKVEEDTTDADVFGFKVEDISACATKRRVRTVAIRVKTNS